MFYKDLGFRLTRPQQDQAAANLNLARREAWRFHRRCDGRLPYEDLEAVAFIGLMKACSRFDPEQGWRFSTYAVPKIRGELLHYVRDHSYALRLSHRMRENWVRGRRLLDHGATDQEVADQLGIDIAEWLDTRIACSGAPLELKDSVPDAYQPEAKEDDRLTRLEAAACKAWRRIDSRDARALMQNFRFDHLLRRDGSQLVALTECFYQGRDVCHVGTTGLQSVSVETGPGGELIIHAGESC